MTGVVSLSPSSEGVRSRTITWTDPARARFRGRTLTGYERLVAIQRGELSPPPAAALIGMQLDEVHAGRTVFSMLADEIHENPMGTMHGGIVATLVDTWTRPVFWSVWGMLNAASRNQIVTRRRDQSAACQVATRLR